ncbi:MAG: glycosyl hydrolase [Candidatus Borkfalkiaceae bacterium]|nr:glycosyl hydrolase [Christensenellaceae bacterium]
MQNIKEGEVDFFRPIPFWSINSDLDESEIERQIGEMHAYGLGGFVFHARMGLVTEYLSEKWFRMVEKSLQTAKKFGMKVWIYDENGWPSGSAGGKLLKNEKFRAGYLRYEKTQRYDASADLVYVFENGVVRRVKGSCGAEEYHNLRIRFSDSYTDILNPEVTDAFLEETHEKYYRRFPESFGKELIGFFTDEPQYYRAETPYSDRVEEEFRREYGEEVKDGLVYLFVDNENGYPFRVKYYTILNRLYCENFYARIKSWCDAHGCMLTGHSVEETRLTTQMWGGADCTTSYLYEHIPAIDNLAKDMTAEISAKALGSVCAQTGNRLALTETFGVSGYSTTPLEMRAIADKQYVYGVDLMVQHLYNYSFAGQGKTDCPPSFGRMMPWISGYKDFNDYFARLGYLIANSEEEVCVAVIPPMESVYLNYVRLNEKDSFRETDEPFEEILRRLRTAGVPYHFLNEKIAEKFAEVKDGKLIVGKAEYSAIVVANCRELKSSTVRLLSDFDAQGGKILIEGRMPEYVDGEFRPLSVASNCKADDLPGPVHVTVGGDVSMSVRKAFGRQFLFFVNQGENPVTIRTEEAYATIDLAEMKGYRSEKEHVVYGKRSLLLEKCGDYENEIPGFSRAERYCPVPVASDENNLTVEKVTVALQDGKRLSGYVYGVFETLAKYGYRGELKAEFRFESDEERFVKLSAEKQPARQIRFNGEEVSFRPSDSDVNFMEADVKARSGENVFSYLVDFSPENAKGDVLYGKDVPESILNRTTYHTFLDQIYVSGHFDTEGHRLVSPREKCAGDLTRQGYGNFCGSVVYRVQAEKSRTPVYIRPIGYFSQCLVRTDGKTYRVMLNDGVMLDRLTDGNVELVCYSTLRNKIGPFHFLSEPDNNINADTFTLRNRWKDEKTNEWYSDSPRLVPFGLDAVEIRY